MKKQLNTLNKYTPKKIYKRPMVLEKMLNVINHQRNTSQNHGKISFHIHQDVFIIIKNMKTTVLVRCGDIRTPVHCCWECKMIQLLWKRYGSSAKIKHRITIYARMFNSRYILPKNLKHGFKQIFIHPCSFIATSVTTTTR